MPGQAPGRRLQRFFNARIPVLIACPVSLLPAVPALIEPAAGPRAQENPGGRQKVSNSAGGKGVLMITKEAARINKNCHCSINQNV
jgi:hypothetical protein